MKEHSRIRFNPVTQEIEVEGSESFVKAYFAKLQSMLSGSPGKSSVRKEVPRRSKAVPKKKVTKIVKTARVSPANKAKKIPKTIKPKQVKKVNKASTKSLSGKRLTNIDAVVMLIRENAEGISTAELKEKTGLLENQIWNIINRATKEGRVKKIKRGVYGAGEDVSEIEGPVIEE
jgi:hypothetical protein